MATQKSKRPLRPWNITSLLVLGQREGVKANYLKAIPVIILEKWVRHGKIEDKANFISTDELAERLEESGLRRNLKGKRNGVLLGSLSTIQNSRNLKDPPLIEYRGAKGDAMFWVNLPYYEPLLQEYRKKYRGLLPDDYGKLFPDGEPDWGPQGITATKSPRIEPKSLRILQVLEEYEAAWQERVQEAENRAKAAEEENRKLSEKLSQSNSALGEITDERLRKRIGTLLKSPLDTVIREAGVILEDRLREIGKAGNDLEGVKLVDALLSPDKKRLVFSSHPGEQEGVKMLYRGAMQFIRNPPMHKLIEYREDTARLLIRLVDSLLLLLSEAEIQQSD